MALAAMRLKEGGAKDVLAMVTHGILSGNAHDKIMNSPISKLVVTNTIPQVINMSSCPKLQVIDMSATISEAIRRTHNGESVSYLFNHAPQ